MTHSGREIEAKHSDFQKTEGPKEFASLAESIKPICQFANPFEEDGEREDWDELLSSLAPFRQSMDIALPSKDYAYSGRHFPAIVGTLLLVLGAMTIAIVLEFFGAIFLAEYGKPGKFLSLVRLAILNLAGVPSSSSDFWFRIVRYFS